MPIATAPSAVPTRPSAVAKMEDRKRPAIADTDEYAPPSKRQAVNGGASKVKEDPNGEYRDEAWLENGPPWMPRQPWFVCFGRFPLAFKKRSSICQCRLVVMLIQPSSISFTPSMQ
ncbi:uncharacterized protein SPSK_05668 [Sporothrix schenckii 1099-18]|uniref:Uncharacterized protein n=1 Tax=Sporothrix schenckii 1099-18 TaxID=1397361 RepID=A0A0F2LTI3_SPOSC|nr:uncharacterized protein SPSK_05668 [Sporothrix schenckii 1099-18]KJR80788.1 hypothetical protein SPSK_05668 [Sporothrix schenckii 1099-18]